MTAAAGLGPLAARLEGSLVLPGDEDWDAARSVWNGLIDRHPIAVIRAVSPVDVIAGVDFARDGHLPLAVRGGGYNVAGHGTVDGGIVIDLWPMNGVSVDARSGIVTVEGGATQHQLDVATAERGLVVPSGLMPSVGIGGLTLGGGIGWLTRAHGLTIDRLVGANLVTAGGRQVRASATENPDLFWGIRGGGGNLGVVTSFEFQAVPLDHEVLAGSFYYAEEDWAGALGFYSRWAPQLPDEMTTVVEWTLLSEEDLAETGYVGLPLLAISLCWSGADVDRGYDLVDELWASGVRSIHEDVAEIDWLGLQSQSEDDLPWGTRAYVKSIYLDQLGAAAIAVLAEHFRQRRSPLGGFDIHQLGGACSRHPAEATAFGPRDEQYLMNIWAYWEDAADDADEIGWVRAVWDAIEPHAVAGHHVSFLGREDDEELQAQALDAYAPAAWDRLVALKDVWDPANLFRHNHNVPPSAAP